MVIFPQYILFKRGSEKILFTVTYAPYSLVDVALGTASLWFLFVVLQNRSCICVTKNKFFLGTPLDTDLKLTLNCYTLHLYLYILKCTKRGEILRYWNLSIRLFCSNLTYLNNYIFKFRYFKNMCEVAVLCK